MVETDLFGEPVVNGHKSVLAQTFSYPPFSVLNAREGWWQERKRQWLALGIKSEVGRGENVLGMSSANNEYMYNKDAYLAKKPPPAQKHSTQGTASQHGNGTSGND